MIERLGFIGTGNLGGAIVTALLKAGFTVTVYDVDHDAVAPLRAQGARVARSARAVGDAASIVFACLPSVEVSKLRIALKDMRLYAETAHALGVPALVGSNIAEIWRAANSLGGQHLVQFFEGFAGVEVKSKD